jgi:tetratricopeptide (TPR) repeat protein
MVRWARCDFVEGAEGILVTVEEALLALLAVVAVVLLFLGLAEALDSRFLRRPARRQRRPLSTTALRPRTEGAVAEAPITGTLSRPGDSSATPTPDRTGDGWADEVATDETTIASKTEMAHVLRVPDDLTTDAASAVARDSSAGAPSRSAVGSEPTLFRLEACARLLLVGKYSELLLMAERSLGRPSDSPSPVMTGLWSVAALAHRALGDEAACGAAFAAALSTNPDPVAAPCPPGLAAMAVTIGRRFLDAAEQSPEGAETRIRASRLAVFWLRWRRAAAPDDTAAEAILQTTAEALSDAYADVASAFIRRQQWSEAWRLIEEGRDRHELSVARAEMLMGLLATSLRRETERLTAPAIRGTKNEQRAVNALERAEAILASLATIALPPRQRAAMTRRIGRAYATLGMRRLRAGSLEPAAAALLRALGIKEIGGRAERQVREAVVHALESMTDQGGESITTLLADGDQAGAVDRLERLRSRIAAVKEAGFAEQDLAVAAGKVKRLAQQVKESPSP